MTHLRLVRHADVDDHLKLGWGLVIPGLLETHHGEWSMILKWECSCPMKLPLARQTSP